MGLDAIKSGAPPKGLTIKSGFNWRNRISMGVKRKSRVVESDFSPSEKRENKIKNKKKGLAL